MRFKVSHSCALPPRRVRRAQARMASISRCLGVRRPTWLVATVPFDLENGVLDNRSKASPPCTLRFVDAEPRSAALLPGAMLENAAIGRGCGCRRSGGPGQACPRAVRRVYRCLIPRLPRCARFFVPRLMCLGRSACSPGSLRVLSQLSTTLSRCDPSCEPLNRLGLAEHACQDGQNRTKILL